jgi:catechol 2,3-dioxygenase-like lactoylglutathione lyase family enzyme
MRLEHINLTVSDAKSTARLLENLFDWHVRWEGPALDDGYTVHVGSDDQYLALYTPKFDTKSVASSHLNAGGMNHVGIVVDDLDAIEQRVIKHGYKPFNHGSYEPGKRFYFRGADNVEFEVISYRG